jgi:hypothetical protein
MSGAEGGDIRAIICSDCLSRSLIPTAGVEECFASPEAVGMGNVKTVASLPEPLPLPLPAPAPAPVLEGADLGVGVAGGVVNVRARSTTFAGMVVSRSIGTLATNDEVDDISSASARPVASVAAGNAGIGGGDAAAAAEGEGGTEEAGVATTEPTALAGISAGGGLGEAGRDDGAETMPTTAAAAAGPGAANSDDPGGRVTDPRGPPFTTDPASDATDAMDERSVCPPARCCSANGMEKFVSPISAGSVATAMAAAAAVTAPTEMVMGGTMGAAGIGPVAPFWLMLLRADRDDSHPPPETCTDPLWAPASELIGAAVEVGVVRRFGR